MYVVLSRLLHLVFSWCVGFVCMLARGCARAFALAFNLCAATNSVPRDHLRAGAIQQLTRRSQPVRKTHATRETRGIQNTETHGPRAQQRVVKTEYQSRGRADLRSVRACVRMCSRAVTTVIGDGVYSIICVHVCVFVCVVRAYLKIYIVCTVHSHRLL